ncbi:MAG: hypothetical protein AAFN30_06415, partial [Actinomycetota bacterium]
VLGSVVKTESDGEGTRLELTMVATPHTLAARLLNPLTKGIVAKALRGDMDAVKAFCEDPDQPSEAAPADPAASPGDSAGDSAGDR